MVGANEHSSLLSFNITHICDMMRRTHGGAISNLSPRLVCYEEITSVIVTHWPYLEPVGKAIERRGDLMKDRGSVSSEGGDATLTGNCMASTGTSECSL